MSHVPARLSPPEMAALPGVPQAPIVSLLARHLASSRPDPIISDPAATALIGELGLAHVGGDWSFRAVEAAAAVRTGILDAAVRSFAESKGHLTVITIGAGLCTRCVRLADIDANWIDIDVPQVAALRAALLPPAPNRVIIGESALGRGWRDRVAVIGGPRLFVLEGLTMYLGGDAVRDLVTGLADCCPGQPPVHRGRRAPAAAARALPADRLGPAGRGPVLLGGAPPVRADRMAPAPGTQAELAPDGLPPGCVASPHTGPAAHPQCPCAVQDRPLPRGHRPRRHSDLHPRRLKSPGSPAA